MALVHRNIDKIIADFIYGKPTDEYEWLKKWDNLNNLIVIFKDYPIFCSYLRANHFSALLDIYQTKDFTLANILLIKWHVLKKNSFWEGVIKLFSEDSFVPFIGQGPRTREKLKMSGLLFGFSYSETKIGEFRRIVFTRRIPIDHKKLYNEIIPLLLYARPKPWRK